MHPLNKLLSTIPDTDYVRDNLLSYADHQASEETENMARPERDFDVNHALDYFNILPFSSMVTRFFPEGDLPKEAGFHFFDVNQTAFYGFLDTSGTVLLGAFDTEEIADVLSERGYEVQSTENSLLLQTDIIPMLSHENPLRHKTIALQNNSIHSLSKSAYEDITTGSSLLDNPAYKSGASALIASGAIRQAQFFPPSRTSHLFLTSANGKRYERIVSRLQEYEPLPMYKLLVVGDVVRANRQHIEHVLVYDDVNIAEKVAEILHQRLQLYYKMPDFLDHFSGTIGVRDTSVWDEITLGEARIHLADLACVIISLERDLPPLGTDYEVSRIDNLYRLVIERVHNKQADYLTVNYTLMG